jgi:lipopolysaccharide export system permease protein
MNQLERYILRTLLGAVAMVLAVLLVLGALSLFIGEQEEIGTGSYGALQALTYSILNLPTIALQALPAAVLVGAMLGIGVLARSNELTVMRCSGMSKLRLIRAAVTGGLMLAAAALLVGEYISPALEQVAEQRKALAKYHNISFASAGGAWIRDGNTIMNVQGRGAKVDVYGGMMLFELAEPNRIASIAHAGRATASPGKGWRLTDYDVSRFDGDRVEVEHAPEHDLTSSASAAFLQLASSDPGSLGIATLYETIHYLRANELSSEKYEFAFWAELARTVALLVAMVFALPFGFGSLRSAGGGARTTIGLGVGIVYFFLQRTVESGTVVFQLDPILLAWLPTALLALIATVLMVRVR